MKTVTNEGAVGEFDVIDPVLYTTRDESHPQAGGNLCGDIGEADITVWTREFVFVILTSTAKGLHSWVQEYGWVR